MLMRLLRNAVGRRGCATRFQVRAGISAKTDEPIPAQKKNRAWVHELQNVSMALQVTYLSSHTALRNILHPILFLTFPPLL